LARWRLLDQRVDRAVDEIDEGVRWLLAEGILVETAAAARPSVYSLSPHAMGAARSLRAELRRRKPAR
jgi:hypothetical protein